MGICCSIGGKKMKKLIISVLFLVLSSTASANTNYKRGTISNLTSTTSGIMIMLDTGLPTFCEGTPYGWMFIKKEHTALISTVLAAWVSGKKTGTVYVFDRNGTGYCEINQFDPNG